MDIIVYMLSGISILLGIYLIYFVLTTDGKNLPDVKWNVYIVGDVPIFIEDDNEEDT